MAFWMAGFFLSLLSEHVSLFPFSVSISRKPETLKPFYTLLSLISPSNCPPMFVVSMSQMSNKSCPLFISIAMTQDFFLLNFMATMPSLLILLSLLLSCLLYPYNIVRETHKKMEFYTLQSGQPFYKNHPRPLMLSFPPIPSQEPMFLKYDLAHLPLPSPLQFSPG